MFEVGKEYRIKMNDGESESSFNGKVLKIEMPLLAVEYGGTELIINTASLGFVSAERDDEDTRAAKLAKHEELTSSLRNWPSDEEDDIDKELDHDKGRSPTTGY